MVRLDLSPVFDSLLLLLLSLLLSSLSFLRGEPEGEREPDRLSFWLFEPERDLDREPERDLEPPLLLLSVLLLLLLLEPDRERDRERERDLLSPLSSLLVLVLLASAEPSRCGDFSGEGIGAKE